MTEVTVRDHCRIARLLMFPVGNGWFRQSSTKNKLHKLAQTTGPCSHSQLAAFSCAPLQCHLQREPTFVLLQPSFSTCWVFRCWVGDVQEAAIQAAYLLQLSGGSLVCAR